MKKEENIREKIIRDYKHDGTSIEDAAESIGDSVRYTLIVDEDSYTKKAISSLKKLKELGYKIDNPKNTWNSPLYKGLNCSIIAPNGTKFELQIHTEKSFQVKEQDTHLIYEIRRNENANEEARALSKELQIVYTSTIPIPKNVIGVDFTKEIGE